MDEAVAGYLVVCFGWSLEFHGRDAFLDELYLRERFRGRGIGTRAQSVYRRTGFADREHYLNAPALSL